MYWCESQGIGETTRKCWLQRNPPEGESSAIRVFGQGATYHPLAPEWERNPSPEDREGLSEEGRSIVKQAKYGDLKYSIRILNNGDDTYTVEVPKLPGCYSVGTTRDECIANIIEAISLHLEGLKKAPPEDLMPAIEVVQSAPTADDHLISLSEACKLLDISDATIRRYVKDGKLPAYNFGKEYKFKVNELYEFIENSKVKVPSKKRAS